MRTITDGPGIVLSPHAGHVAADLAVVGLDGGRLDGHVAHHGGEHLIVQGV
jgi:hypothetical protein